MSDRTVHGVGESVVDGSYEVVRYDRGGKWWIEFPDGKRTPVSLDHAVAFAHRAHLGRPGGGTFDARWKRAQATPPSHDESPETGARGAEE